MYACPTGIRGELLTYNLMDGVNGMPRNGTHTNGVATIGPNGKKLWVKKKSRNRPADLQAGLHRRRRVDARQLCRELEQQRHHVVG